MRAIGMALVGGAMAMAMATTWAGTPLPGSEGEDVLTLRVDGQLSIDPEGRVKDYRISTQLDPQVERLVSRAVATWRFKPILVDGKPAIAHSPMRITLAAVEMDQGYQVSVDNVVFRPNTREEHEAAKASMAAHRDITVAGEPPEPRVWISSKSLRPPEYPAGMMKSGVEGIVLLNLRLNPDGSVADVFAAQSSLLNVRGTQNILDRGRALLERSAMMSAKRWTFVVDAENVASLKPSDLTVRVPVEYRLGPPQGSLAGKWRHEFRGPQLTPPWLAEAEATIGVSDMEGGDALIAGNSPFALSDKSVIGATL